MKNLKCIFGLFLLIFALNLSAQQANYVGHVTLLKKNASMLSFGGGISSPGSDAKEKAYVSNSIALNADLFLPLIRKGWNGTVKGHKMSFGLNFGGSYNLGGNGDFGANYKLFSITAEVQPQGIIYKGTDPRNPAFKFGAGPQANFYFGDFIISPMVLGEYYSMTQKELSAVQTSQFNGKTYNFNLAKLPETKTSGFAVTPKLRFQYFFTKNIGLWLEGNYSVLPKIKTLITTFTPNGNPGQDGSYNIDQMITGTNQTHEISVNNSSFGFGGGIVIGFGGVKNDTPNSQSTPENISTPIKDEIVNDVKPNSIGEIFIATPIKKENIEKQSCVKILSPSNGSNQNINENVKILLSNEGLKQANVDVKIYKISNDKNFWNKAENRKDLFDNNNTVFLSSKFQKESETTGFKPISVDAKQSGAVLESNIDKGKLTEGAYKMVVISNCGVTSSNFMVSSSALTTISLTTNCKEKFGDYSYTFVVKNTGTAPINVTSIPAFTSSTGAISGFSVSPTLPIVIAAGGTQNFTGNFTYSGTYTGDVYATVSGHQVGNVNLTSQDTEQGELKSCICNFCDKVLEFDYNQSPNATYSATSNSLSIHQDWWNMNTTAVTVVGAKAEIVSFEREISEDCKKCDKDSNQWGNFISGHSGTTNGSFGNATGSVTGNTHHTLYFANPNSYSFDLNISIPPISTLKCCCEKIRFKVRYTYIFKDKNGECKMCSAVFEYFYQRGDCPKKNPGDSIDISTGNINYVK